MKRLKLNLALAIVLIISAITYSYAQKPAVGFKDAQAILRVMNNQQKSWNKGDLAGFMAGYWNHDSLVFIGKRGPSYGWEPVMSNYRKSYPDAAAMGQLQFDKLDVRVLSTRNAWVMGRWELTKEEKTVGGWFTLLFEKKNGQWVIVADHTGSDAPAK